MLNNTLFIGDLHAMPANYEDTGIILDYAKELVRENPTIVRVVFLGDLFHTHSVVRQEIAHFVRRKIREIFEQRGTQIFILAGNHDGSSPSSVELNAIRMVFDGDRHVTIVDSELEGHQEGPFFMVPFIGDNEQFVKTCQAFPDKILVCHQTVKGACYENRSLAPGGVDQSRLPQRRIISGHIHLEQRVDRVFYPGTPRALTASEHNEDKGLWVYNDENDEWLKYSLNGKVKCFVRYDIEQGKEQDDMLAQQQWNPKDDVRVCIHGTETFYREMLTKYERLAAKVKFIPDIRKDLKKKVDIDSEGGSVNKSLHRYVHKIYDADDNMKEKVWKKLQNLIPNLGSVNS